MQHDTNPTGDADRALAAHLELVGHDIARWLELFADDAVVEFPYAPAVGTPARLVGKPAIAAYFGGAPGTFKDLRFTGLRRFPGADPEQAIAEVHGSARVGPHDRPYEQDYVMVVHTRAGKISAYREYWNPIPALAALDGSDFIADRQVQP